MHVWLPTVKLMTRLCSVGKFLFYFGFPQEAKSCFSCPRLHF